MTDSLLCLDPSSTCCGAAYFPSLAHDAAPTYLHAIRPTSSWDAMKRIDFIVAGVLETVRRWRPSLVLMEWSDGRLDAARTRQRGRAYPGMAVMGQAQGAVRQALMDHPWWWPSPTVRGKIETVSEADWTCQKGKDARALTMAAMFPLYRDFLESGQDGPWTGKGSWKHGAGLDVADSVGIGVWRIGEENTRRAVERAGR